MQRCLTKHAKNCRQEASGHIEAAERRSRVINKKLYEAESFETDLKMPEQNENDLFGDKN